MRKHRNPRQRLSNPPTPDNQATDCGCPDLDDTLRATRDQLWKADAFITVAESMIVEHGVGIDDADDGTESYDYDGLCDDDVRRRRSHLEEFVESAKLAVRAAQYAHNQTIAAHDKYRAENARAVEVAAVIVKHRGKA